MGFFEIHQRFKKILQLNGFMSGHGVAKRGFDQEVR